LQRDLDLLGIEWTNQMPLDMKNTEVMVSEVYTGPDKLIIEDLMLDVKKNPLIDIISNLIASMCLTRDVQKTFNEKLRKDLFVLNESTFAYLLQYSTEVAARNVLDDKKISKNLWSVETIPRDTLFYGLVIVSESKSEVEFNSDTLLNEFSDKVSDTYIQFGGYETIGYGWCATDVITKDVLKDIL
jgi:CRISPR type III-B/RAMP module RAMP protein Cmr4